jgi:hypothetical protein
VRGAIRTLEAVGFLDRAIPASGSLYKATPEGLHRKPVLFVFGSDYALLFIAANARAAAARGRRSRCRLGHGSLPIGVTKGAPRSKRACRKVLPFMVG